MPEENSSGALNGFVQTMDSPKGRACCLLGEKLFDKMISMIFKHIPRQSLLGKQQRKMNRNLNAIRNQLRVVPPFVSECETERIHHYIENNRSDRVSEALEGKWDDGHPYVLSEFSYCLGIAALETRCGGTYRFGSIQEASSFEQWREEFQCHDEVEIKSGILLLLLLTRTSYEDIADDKHPRRAELDWVKLSSHFGRDRALIAALHIPITSLSHSSSSYPLWLSAKIACYLPQADNSRVIDICYKQCSVEDIRQAGGCVVCFKDIKDKKKATSTIFSRCRQGLFHTPFEDSCSYVCNKCGERGHFIDAHN